MSKKMQSFRCEEEIIKKLEEIAKQQNRTLSNLIETILQNYLKGK